MAEQDTNKDQQTAPDDQQPATPVTAEGVPNAADQRDADAPTIEEQPAPDDRQAGRIAAPDVDYQNHDELPVAARRLTGPNPTVIDPADIRGEQVTGVGDGSGKVAQASETKSTKRRG